MLRHHPMQRDECLLLNALDRHARDLPRPHGLENGLGIRAIRLIPAHVRADVGRGHQRYGMPVPLRDDWMILTISEACSEVSPECGIEIVWCHAKRQPDSVASYG